MLSSGTAVLQVAEPSYSLGDIRLAAMQSGLAEIYFNAESRVISFSPNRSGELVEYPRINVYYSTRTVGTCIDHPQRGKTQLFSRNVDLELLRRLMRAPRLHTARGYYIRKERTSNHPNAMYASRVFPRTLSEEAEADLEIERLKEHAAQIAELLVAATAVKEACQKRRENEARRKAEELRKGGGMQRAEGLRKWKEMANRYTRGEHCAYILPEQHHKHVDECFDLSVVSVATNGDATIFLYENGDWAWTPGLTKQLRDKLHGRSRKLPPPVYVSIGSRDRYYIRFADGQSQWVGPDGLTKTLKDTDKKVATVAFGEEWDSYFVVFTDGCWAYNNVPDRLNSLVDRRQRRSDLTCVSLGPDGQYYLRARNGRAWWGGLTTSQLNFIGKYTKSKHSLTFLDFGRNALFLRHNEHSMLYA